MIPAIAYQGVERLYVGDKQLLAKLSLPSCVLDIKDQFVLHPCLLDSAFQSSIGLIMGDGARNGDNLSRPSLLFAISELEIYSSCSSKMWVHVRYSNSNRVGSNSKKVDITLCDESGKVCVEIKEAASKDPDKYYATKTLKKYGFMRKKCEKCRLFFFVPKDS